jgi:hypothetical protein
MIVRQFEIANVEILGLDLVAFLHFAEDPFSHSFAFAVLAGRT